MYTISQLIREIPAVARACARARVRACIKRLDGLRVRTETSFFIRAFNRVCAPEQLNAYGTWPSSAHRDGFFYTGFLQGVVCALDFVIHVSTPTGPALERQRAHL